MLDDEVIPVGGGLFVVGLTLFAGEDGAGGLADLGFGGPAFGGVTGVWLPRLCFFPSPGDLGAAFVPVGAKVTFKAGCGGGVGFLGGVT